MTTQTMNGIATEHKMDNKFFSKFLFGGRAQFSVRNTLSKNTVYFRVRTSKDNPNMLWVFTKGNSLPDSHPKKTKWGYIASMVKDEGATDSAMKLFVTTGCKLPVDSLEVRSFKWLFDNRDNIPDYIEVYHQNKCGCCGRKLIVPESIATGFGPYCMKMKNIKI